MAQCPVCDAGAPKKKVFMFPYRNAKRDEDGEVKAYGSMKMYQTTDEKVATTLREMMRSLNQAELVFLDPEV